MTTFIMKGAAVQCDEEQRQPIYSDLALELSSARLALYRRWQPIALLKAWVDRTLGDGSR